MTFVPSEKIVGKHNARDLEMKILVVDDEPTITQLLQMTLRAMGFSNVETAAGGKDALAAIDDAETPFDCFLFDIQMPEVDGLDLCKVVRAHSDYGRTPIIMLTAMSDRQYIEKAFSVGANDYIIKPFEIEDLISRINDAAQIHREIIAGGRMVDRVSENRDDDGEATKIDLAFPVSFDGVPGFLDQSTLRNYLDRMERSQLRHGGVSTVRIDNIDSLYEKATPGEFVALLSDMSKMISKGLLNERAHFTYLGSGCFVVLALRVDKPGFDKYVATAINTQLEAATPRYPGRDPERITTTVGRLYRKNADEFGSVADTLSRARSRIQVNA